MATARKPPAAKTPRAEAPKAKSAPTKAARHPLGLVPTATEGVYRNPVGVLVNSMGVALSFMEARRAESADRREVVGHEVSTPAQFLKAVALDPRVDLDTRLEAAKAAAPYTDRKQPAAMDGGAAPDGTPLPIRMELSVPPEVLKQMSGAHLDALSEALRLMREQSAPNLSTQGAAG